MLNIRDLKIDAAATLGSKKLLVDVVPVYEYKDNQRMDKVVAYRYVVALPERAFEKIGVRIDGPQLIDTPDGFVEVTFHGLELTAYESGGKVNIIAKATGISLANTKH
ncbi:MAG: hypothetical protein IKU81_09420 [Oscillibacter sp.]|nr:hypothetical protein [Oscillibacter sp.]